MARGHQEGNASGHRGSLPGLPDSRHFVSPGGSQGLVGPNSPFLAPAIQQFLLRAIDPSYGPLDSLL
jgi:hypothetical protein